MKLHSHCPSGEGPSLALFSLKTRVYEGMRRPFPPDTMESGNYQSLTELGHVLHLNFSMHVPFSFQLHTQQEWLPNYIWSKG